MRYLAVLPYVNDAYASPCFDSCKFSDILLIDNTVNNRGIMRSHNLGIDLLALHGSDWLIVVGSSLVFGPPGGEDFLAHLDDATQRGDTHVLEAADVYGWHLIAFSRHCLEVVGRWDENFTPYGFCDLDYSWRIQQSMHNAADPQSGAAWRKVTVDVHDRGMGHGVKDYGVVAPAEPRLKYLCDKWGVTVAEDGAKGPFTYTTPFGYKDKDVRWWPDAPNGGKWDDGPFGSGRIVT